MISQIEASGVAATIRTSAWVYPILEAVHIAALATVFGSLLLLELRVFGAGRAIPLPNLARLASRAALLGFAVAATSGALMWSSDAAAVSANPAFRVKLGLITLAGINAAMFHWRHGAARDDLVARLQGGLSLALWTGVIIAGRWIAYV